MPIILARGRHREEDKILKLDPGKTVRPYLKNKLNLKGLKGMAQVVEHLPSKCNALSSKPSATKEKKIKATKEYIHVILLMKNLEQVNE
jgi:hypothetical protein